LTPVPSYRQPRAPPTQRPTPASATPSRSYASATDSATTSELTTTTSFAPATTYTASITRTTRFTCACVGAVQANRYLADYCSNCTGTHAIQYSTLEIALEAAATYGCFAAGCMGITGNGVDTGPFTIRQGRTGLQYSGSEASWLLEDGICACPA
jgi:hypothetical protein